MLVTLEDQAAKAQEVPMEHSGSEVASTTITTAHTSAPDIYLDFDQRCWVSITNGAGKQMFAGYAPAGRSLVQGKVARPITVRDGCPGHVAFTVDGKAVDPPREPGHAENRVEVVTLGGASVKPQSYIYVVPEERWRPCPGRCA
jgi:hypothetical protein